MIALDQGVLFLVILVPLLGAVLTMMLPKERPGDAWYFAIGVAALCLALSIYIVVRYDYGVGGFQLGRTFQW